VPSWRAMYLAFCSRKPSSWWSLPRHQPADPPAYVSTAQPRGLCPALANQTDDLSNLKPRGFRGGFAPPARPGGASPRPTYRKELECVPLPNLLRNLLVWLGKAEKIVHASSVSVGSLFLHTSICWSDGAGGLGLGGSGARCCCSALVVRRLAQAKKRPAQQPFNCGWRC
jgi:hypothetical protein